MFCTKREVPSVHSCVHAFYSPNVGRQLCLAWTTRTLDTAHGEAGWQQRRVRNTVVEDGRISSKPEASVETVCGHSKKPVKDGSG
jgi:hypothetical protein